MTESLTIVRGLMRKELLALTRDLHGLAALFLMPLMFIVVMSLALQKVFSPPAPAAHYAVLDHDGGASARALVQQWAADHGTAQALPVSWPASLQSGQLGYVLEIQPGFSARLAVLDGTEVTSSARALLWLEPGTNAATAMATEAALERAVGQLRGRLLLAQLDTSLIGKPHTEMVGYIQAQRWSSGPLPTSVQQNVPAWLVFGMFFVVTALGSLFVEERRGGALARLRSLGVSPGWLLSAKALPYLGVNLIQAALMLAVGVWLMPVLGASGLSLQAVDPLALSVTLLCISIAAVGLGLGLSSLMRTSAQAHAVGPLLNVLMGALGGIMVPTTVMPAAMQSLARLSPMHWALEALLSVLVRGAQLPTLWPLLLPLLTLAALSLSAAVWQLRRPLLP